MPAAYSADIRGRVIARVESGSSRREAADQFEVSPSSAIRWVSSYRATGSCAAKPRGGSTSPLEKHTDFLLALIEEQPDLTLDEIVCAMRKQRIPGSRTSVWRSSSVMTSRSKKSLRAAEQERADVARARRRWSAIDARTTRHIGYQISQTCRKMAECIFGWGKQHGTMRKTKHRGIAAVTADFMLNLIAYNLVRIPKLIAA